MLKRVTVLLIIIISLYAAYSIVKRGREKLSFYSSVLDFIKFIKNQITFYCTPTNTLLTSYSNDILEKCGFLELIREKDWKRAVDENRFLEDDSKNLLKCFFMNLGKSSAEVQIKNCDYAINGIEEIYENMQRELPRKNKAYSCLSVVFGLMAVILLL